MKYVVAGLASMFTPQSSAPTRPDSEGPPDSDRTVTGSTPDTEQNTELAGSSS